MTELSFAWDCLPAVGDFSGYTLEIVEATQRAMGNLDFESAGVVYWTSSVVFPAMSNATDELLEPAFVSGNTVRVNTGVGMVQGWVYLNDVDIDTNVAGGNTNATDIIGLRRDLTGQSVRLFLGRGAAGLTYPLVQTATTWEIPLAEVALDGAGNFSSILDVREFVKTPLYPVQQHSLFKEVVAGRNETTSTVLFQTVNNQVSGSGRGGVDMNATQVTTVKQHFDIPYDAIAGEVDVEWVILVPAGTGDVELQMGYELRDGTNVGSSGVTVNIANLGARFIYVLMSTHLSANILGVRGDWARVHLGRQGNDGNDTFPSTIQAVGARMLYNKQYASTWFTTLPLT